MNWSIVFISTGWTGILLEFVRPGWVVPGAAGAVLLLVGLTRTLPAHPAIAILTSIPFLMAAGWLLAIADRARRNKRAL